MGNGDSRSNENEDPTSSRPKTTSYLKKIYKPPRNGSPNVLLLGQTGAGKTSLLNLLKNFETLEAAKEDINMFTAHNRVDLENEIANNMQSKTNQAYLYDNVLLQCGTLNVIDTPGFGDTRGIEQDQEHVENIINTIKHLDHLQAIVLVLNGRESRVNTTLSYVLSEIASVLPEKILDNTFVILTNTASVLHLNFDTSILESDFGLKVKEICYIDNPLCQLEKARLNKDFLLVKDKHLAKELQRAFEKSLEDLCVLFKVILSCVRVQTKYFTQVYELKQEVENKLLVLRKEFDNDRELKATFEQTKKEIEDGKSLAKIKSNYKTISKKKCRTPVKTEDYNTVCQYSGCEKNCHESCSLDLCIDAGDYFLQCYAFGPNKYTKCHICGHGTDYHLHSHTLWKETTIEQEYKDDVMFQEYLQANSMVKDKEEILRKLQERIQQLNDKMELNQIEITKQISSYKEIAIPKNYTTLVRNQVRLLESQLEATKSKEGVTDKEINLLEQTINGLKRKEEIIMNIEGEELHADGTRTAGCKLVPPTKTGTAGEKKKKKKRSKKKRSKKKRRASPRTYTTCKLVPPTKTGTAGRST